ncbi:MAG TPA: YdeI/OmpD-associated family protein [Acidimicrobiales bacterium]|nr:YdeI/OmpD-associated family protein [Acidimicrobiales bacterium]
MPGSERQRSARFRAQIERKHPELPRYALLPDAAVRALGLTATTTVDGSIAGVPITRKAVKPWGDGRWFIDVTQPTCTKAGIDKGDEVDFELRVVSEAPPDDLVEALAASPTASAVWDRLTPSPRRQVVNDILRAKKPETRAKRIADYIQELEGAPRTHSHKYGDLAD